MITLMELEQLHTQKGYRKLETNDDPRIEAAIGRIMANAYRTLGYKQGDGAVALSAICAKADPANATVIEDLLQ